MISLGCFELFGLPLWVHMRLGAMWFVTYHFPLFLCYFIVHFIVIVILHAQTYKKKVVWMNMVFIEKL